MPKQPDLYYKGHTAMELGKMLEQLLKKNESNIETTRKLRGRLDTTGRASYQCAVPKADKVSRKAPAKKGRKAIRKKS